MLPEFDVSKFKLGVLCKREHDWNQTGQSLRRSKDGSCIECKKLTQREYKKTEKCRAYNRAYDRSEKRRQWQREYNQRDYVQARIQAHAQTEQFKVNQQRYRQSEKGKATRKRNQQEYRQTETGRQSQQRYNNSTHGKAKKREYQQQIRGSEQRRQALLRYTQSEKGRASLKRNTIKRRVRLRQGHSSHYTPQALKLHLAQFGDRCAYCGSGEKMSIDHLISVANGGSDCLSNLVLACADCNQSKGSRDVLEWYKSRPFYSDRRWKELLRLLGKSEENYNQIPLL